MQNVSQLQPLTDTGYLIASIVRVLLVFVALLGIVAYLTLLERKVSAWMQDRIGPNRVGRGGFGQPIADGIKNILKEETNPAEANAVFFTLAPMLSIIPAMVTFAVIPFASPLRLGNTVIPMVVADLPVGILFLLAFSSLGVYGIVIAGWASYNKYALLGGLRAGAQMISYEIALGLALMSIFFVVGNVTLPEVVYRQQEMNLWFAAQFSVSFLFFWIASFAETNRLPFDLPEAESELVTGYHTEYSSMKFSMFFISEYAHVLTVSALMATLFLGGWDIPGWGRDDMLGFDAQGQWVGQRPEWWLTLLTLGMFGAKTFFFIMVFMIVRWTVPRFRYDQVMDLGWKIMLPAALTAVVVTAATVLALDSFGVRPEKLYGPTILGRQFVPLYGLVLAAVNAVMLAAVVWIMDKGHVLAGTGAMEAKRAHAQELARRRTAQRPVRVPVGGAAQP
ncbi:MAG: NADH-ubiquinone oxidoreductase chain H [uncultured Gemmatimonadetes bacterium]|uniref:NADH-quinone oxidoreductase subunit H n=1 Tax=uncultured Gemmatimonadota bacterium TaxID=203437 RepID=A0A6J4MVX4_9BACT|nr:MAG: NADH-ubiquinone oxidoreductase chain H [uncultured Gemmatimonadota bacterium]